MEYKGVKLSLDMETDEFESAFSRVFNMTKAWDTNIKKIKQNLKFDGSNIQQYTALVENLRKKYNETENVVDVLKQTLQKGLDSGQIKEYSSQWVNLTNKITTLEKNLQITGRNINEVEDDWRKFGRVSQDTLNGLNKPLQEQKTLWERLHDSSDRFFSNLKANLVSNVISGGLGLISKGISSIINGLRKLGTGYINLMKQGIEYNATIQDYTRSLQIILNDTDGTTERLINNIKKVGATYGLGVEGLLEGIQNLAVAGVDIKKAETAITSFSKALKLTGGGNAELSRIIQNLQQIQNAGGATARDLREFANAGLPIYKILAEYSDRFVGDYVANEVKFEDVVNAMTQAVNNANSALSKGAEVTNQTFSGQIEMIRERWNQLLGDMAEGGTSSLTSVVLPEVNNFLEKLLDSHYEAHKIIIERTGSVRTALQEEAEGDFNYFNVVFAEGLSNLIKNISESGVIEEFLNGGTMLIQAIGEAFNPDTSEGQANIAALEELASAFLDVLDKFMLAIAPAFKNVGYAIGDSIGNAMTERLNAKINAWEASRGVTPQVSLGVMHSGGFGDYAFIPKSLIDTSKLQSGGFNNTITINVHNNGANITPSAVRGWASIISEELGKEL